MEDIIFVPDLNELKQNKKLQNGNKIVIVSIIGKSPFDELDLKIKTIGKIFNTTNEQNTKQCKIEILYDDENETIYLNLHNWLDSDILINNYDWLLEKYSDNDDKNSDAYLIIYNEIKNRFSTAFLLLLHISHIIILSHPTLTFDTSYIQYFKVLENLRQDMSQKIAENLKSFPHTTPELLANSRLSIPRMIFYFNCSRNKLNNMKKFEHNLEDRIYHILKKTRILGNSNNSTGTCLFSIPMNEEFVFISKNKSTDKLGNCVKNLIANCQSDGGLNLKLPFCNKSSDKKNFEKFLQIHIQQTRNGNGNRMQNQSNEFLTFAQWIDYTELMLNIFQTNDIETLTLHTDTRFSEQRCLKVLPMAIAQYQSGLPPHYPRTEHETRLTYALSLFRAQARGPMYNSYKTKLELDCLKYWENGHQQCEYESMTGNPCKLPKHDKNLLEQHISGYIYKSVCDCGRKIGLRDDPYTIKQANYLFYQQIANECACNKLERIKFPIFEPSIKEYSAAKLNDTEDMIGLQSILSDKSLLELTPEDHDNIKCLSRQASTTEYLPGMLTLTSPMGLLPIFSSWSLICLGPSSLYSHNVGLSDLHHPGFLNSTNYLLPWDVIIYGTKTKNLWMNKFGNRSNLNNNRRGRGGILTNTSTTNNTSTTSATQLSVKVFLGVEYECTSGHRFMLSGPDKMLKAAPGSIVKDTGHKIVESDMPLYYPCVCRANKFAQLMRLHVVTPKAPVHCTLNPRVQPAPDAPIFISTAGEPIKLTQSAYWVMRLPFIYQADKDYYKHHSGGKLLQGVFGVISEME